MSRAAQTVPTVQEATTQSQQAPPNSELDKLLSKNHVPVRDGQFVPDSLDGYWRLADMYVKSGMVPRSLEGRNAQETTAKLTICMEAGACLGLSISHSVVNIMVVNNRPALWGDALPALIRKSGVCGGIEEWFDGTGDGYTAHCTMRRITKLANGDWAKEEQTRSFSVADAKKAGLWGKQGPWQNYGPRMLQVRARAWNGRDMFADVLMGFGVVEELQDIPPDAQDKAVATQAAIDALKPAQDATKTDPQWSKSPERMLKVAANDATMPTVAAGSTRTSAAKDPVPGPLESYEEEPGQAGDAGQEQDEGDVDAQEAAEIESAHSQLTQGTDAESSQASQGVQQVQAHNVSAKPRRGTKSIGDASAEPPPGMLLGQQSKPPERPWGTRKN